MSCSGSPSTATRLASWPVARVPSSGSPSSSALCLVGTGSHGHTGTERACKAGKMQHRELTGLAQRIFRYMHPLAILQQVFDDEQRGVQVDMMGNHEPCGFVIQARAVLDGVHASLEGCPDAP